MDKQYPTVAKIPVLDTGKLKQWQFRIQQYLQHEHYALWEVIEFGDSYVVPASSSSTTTTDTTSGETGTNKFKTARELWAAILKTFGGNEATKKTKKNLLKQQYGNFKAEGSETLEQTFNRMQVIIGQLQFMDVEIKQDDLNHKFLTNLAPEWLMHTIVWRNRGDLDTMSLDNLYNHLRVYESEVQKKSEPNSQNMAFISASKPSSRNEDGNTACVSTASTNVPIASASVATISQDTACTYIASQSSGSQIKFKDINQIDEDDMEEIDIKWNMVLLSMRADKFWKKTGKKISIQGSDVAGFDKLKVECFNCHKMGHFARECRAPRNQDRGRRDNYRQGSKAKEQDPKALMRSDKIKDGLGYSAVPPPPAQLYLSPKKDLSWTGLPECADDTVTDYSRPSPTVESTSKDDQNKNSFVSETVPSPITPKPFIKFLKPKDSQSKSKLGKTKSPKKPPVKAVPRTILMTKAIRTVAALGGCKITGKWTIKTGKLEFKNVYFVKDLKTPRQHNMYSIDLNNIVSHIDLTCLVAKASTDECMLWHRRLVTYDFSSFTWTFFLKSKDETSGILKKFITEIENLKDLKVKIIRTLIEAARTMLADAKLPVTFWAEAVKTACYVQNRVLVNKSHNETPYELFNGRSPAIGFLKPIGCHVMILNNLENLGKFKEKGDEVDAGTISSNLLGTKVAASQEVKKDVSSLRYIALPNWAHDALLEYSSSVRPIRTKWVLKNKNDERGIVIRNKARLVAQDHTQEEGIDYDEVFAHVARIEAIRLFLAYASFMGFTVYQMDVKSAFLYGTIDEEVYVMQPPGFQDPEFLAKVYKVEKAMYGLHQAPRA
nr:ribonuclease H-like domain-containing protein [Tanacetum cinerariifolium]